MPRDTSGKPVMMDMQRSKEEKKRENMPVERSSVPDYPYGLRVDLDHEGLKKLGFKDLPEVGHEIEFHAKAHVTSSNASKHEGEEERRNVGIQITHLGIKHKEEEGKEEKRDRKRH